MDWTFGSRYQFQPEPRLSQVHAGLSRRPQRWLTAFLLTLSAVTMCRAELVPNDAIGNDPERERLCFERTKAKNGQDIRLVPFQIDINQVRRIRADSPDAAFIVFKNSTGLYVSVECEVNSATGQYGPMAYGLFRFVLMDTPKRFDPSISSLAGRKIAFDRCFDAIVHKINLPNYVSSSANGLPIEVGPPEQKGRIAYPEGRLIGGVAAKQYDVVIEGTSLYKSNAIDMNAYRFTCLMSPMLDIRAIQIGGQNTTKSK